MATYSKELAYRNMLRTLRAIKNDMIKNGYTDNRINGLITKITFYITAK